MGLEQKISVVGAGSWGTSIAILLAERGFKVHLWVFEKELVSIIKNNKVNGYYLPDFTLPENIEVSNNIEKVVVDSSFVIMVVPSHVFRETLKKCYQFIPSDAIIVSATKGIENGTLQRMSEIIEDTVKDSLKDHIAVLSGPSFAREVCQHTPTTVVVASKNERIAQEVQLLFKTPYFRTYTNTDVIGVEIGGALKNVIAIAAGASDGLGFGNNTKAALLTRGLAEMTRLGTLMGAVQMTFAGLSGMGDLILTCNSTLSRNYSTGFKLGKGVSLKEIIESRKMVAEGIHTTRSANQLASEMNIELPIIEQVYAILFENKKAGKAVRDLMKRTLKKEINYNASIYSKKNSSH